MGQVAGHPCPSPVAAVAPTLTQQDWRAEAEAGRADAGRAEAEAREAWACVVTNV